MSEHGGGGGETSYNSVAGGTVVHGSVIQAHRIESLHIDQYVPPPARQLPHDTGPFVNRVRELDQLHSVARTADGPSGPRTVLLTGLGGIGKTKLVAHWAHLGDLREWFPRHLYVDLEEMRRDGAVDVAAVLRGFLTGLGVHRELLPTDRPGLTALYRSMTATGRVLVVVDNAQHAAEVRGLTPGQGLLVVTSRKLLTALVTRNGAVPIVVEPLDKTAGVELVREWSKDAAETTAAELVRLCGGLPLALLTAGDWLADRPHLGLEHVVRTLAAEDLLTADPTDGSPSMSSVLDAVHDQLPVAAQRLYALVGAADLVDLTHPLARVAAGSDADADTAIGALVNAHLVTHTGEGHDRYRPHDLVRAHARAVAGRLSAPERQELLADAVDLYVDLTAHADQVVGGSGRFRMQPRPRPVGHDLFGTRAQALDWLDAESANLRGITRAAMAGERHDAVWRICESLWPWFNARRPFAAWLELQDRGVEAAQWLGRRDVEVRMRNQLARHHYTLRAFDDAERELAVADALLDLVDDAVLHGMVHETRGLTALAVGRDQDALALFERALHANRRAGDAHGIAVQTYNLAQARIAAGDFTAALALLDEVTALTDTGSPMRTKIDLVRARALRGLGDLDAALDAAITAAELAALDRLTLLAATGLDELDPLSPAAAFARQAPRLDPEGDLYAQLLDAERKFDRGALRPVIDGQLEDVDRSGELTRERMYAFLAGRGVRPPSTPPVPTPVPEPEPVEGRPAATYDVTGDAHPDGVVDLERRPVVAGHHREARGFYAAAVEQGHRQWRQSAEVVARTAVDADAELPAVDWLSTAADDFPDQDVLVAAVDEGRALVRPRGGPLLEAHAERTWGAARPALDPLLLGAAVHVWLVGGGSEQRLLDGLLVRTGRRHVRIGFRAAP